MAEISSLANKNAMVTGAAGGIGTAVVRALAAEGATVAVVDKDAARLDDLVAKLATEDLRAIGYRADVTDCAGVEAVVDQIEHEVGMVDVLVNAAGVLRVGSATEMSERDWRAIFTVNTDGVFYCCRAVAARMKSRRRGTIVTIASNAGRVPRMQMAAYGASKAAAASYTKTLGLELAEYGIRCNIISPGSTDTDMLRSLWSGDDDREMTVRGTPGTYKLGIPLGRIAEPSNIADAVLFLLSDQARHITMQDLCVDGGAILGV